MFLHRRRASRILLLAHCSLAACVGSNYGHGASHAPQPAIARESSSIVFGAAPPSMPKGVQMAVLEGDPRHEGMFTLRLKAPPGFALPPHTHPVAERVTVLEGTISVGFGAARDDSSARHFGPGSFYVNPAGIPHYVFSEQGTVVQITGEGPWRVDLVPPP